MLTKGSDLAMPFACVCVLNVAAGGEIHYLYLLLLWIISTQKTTEEKDLQAMPDDGCFEVTHVCLKLIRLSITN